MPRHHQKLFLEGPIGTALIRLAIPIMLGNVLQTGYQLTDAFWVGRLGAAAVAVVSVSFPITFLVIAAGGGIGVQLCIVSAFRASGNMLTAMVIALVSQWIFQLPLAYVLSKCTELHAMGLWWSFPITNVAVAIVSVCWFAERRLEENAADRREQTGS
jgi:Na+-driven multidrug efflux pump